MDTRNGTQLPPPKPPSVGSSGRSLWVMLLALIAWGAAFWMANAAPEQDEPTTYYTMAVVVAVIGAGLLIVGALYDIDGRRRSGD